MLSQNNPSSFLSLTESSEAAETLIAKSPLTYHLATNTGGYHTVPTPSSSADKPPPPQQPTPRPDPEEPPTDEHPAPEETGPPPADGVKSFVIHIFPRGPNKRHVDMIQDSQLYGPWPAYPETNSFAARNLRMSIPEGEEMKDCLADWETGGQLCEDGDVVKERSDREYFRRRNLRRNDKNGLAGVFQ
ncbi:hypothetical protein IMZ48_38915 [Candidatus Bathyarchaeota archaeon]|nr:hypothetical protein [Candidatus Bathyarchaeota archaeon]